MPAPFSDPTSSAPGSGSTGFFDDPTKLGWAKLGIDLLGGLTGGAANARASAAEMAERQREFDKAFGLQSGQAAVGAQRSLETSPLRDRVMYKLQQVLGQTPGQFKPHDIFNGGGVASQGGYDTNRLQTADQSYRPGMGGVNTDVLKKFLTSIGYAPPASPPANRMPQGVTL